MLTIEETRALANVNPEFEPILKSGNPILNSWNMGTDIQEIRGLIAQMRQAQQKPDPATLPRTEEDIQIRLRDGFEVTARIYKPRDAPADGCPGFIVFHGGGYMVGDLETEADLCALFTTLGGIAVNIDYRHAPEHPFPTAVNDAFDATKWVLKNTNSLGINAEMGLLIGGESSGAEIALVLSHLCRDEKLSPPLTGVFAPMPGGVNEETVPEKYKDHFFSKQQNSDAPFVSTESLKFIYKSNQTDPNSPLAFPVAFPDHKGIPKTYFQICGMDPVRDCGLVLEQVYKDDGVPTKLDIYPGMPHGFWAMFPQLQISQKRVKDNEEAFKWLLAK